MVTFSCFRIATFRPATRKYAIFHALRFRLLFVVFLPGGANGRHAKIRQNHHFAGFRVATVRVFGTPKARLYDMAQISHHTILFRLLYFHFRATSSSTNEWRDQTVAVSITNVNDASPTFSNQLYFGSVNEGAASG